MRFFLLVAAALSPWFVRRLLLRWLCNGRFGDGAYVGFSWVDTQELCLGEGARIGSLNIFRCVRAVGLERSASIGNLNWFTGKSVEPPVSAAGMDTGSGRRGRLLLREGGAITARHYIDLHGDIDIGKMAILAGVRSTVLTHAIDIAENSQKSADVVIGDYSFIGTNCVILPGVRVAERVVVGAGSVVRGALSEAASLYAGVPARKVKDMDPRSGFFVRSDPFVFWDK